jgi:ketosteroid isomerase-like protein
VSASEVATLRAAYQAFGRGDIPAVLAALDPQVAWECPAELPFGGTFRGPEEVLGYFQALAGTFESLEVVPDLFLDAGPEHVVVRGRDRVTLGGEPMDVAFLHLATLRGGRVVAFREYLDSGRVLRRLDALAAGIR